MTQPPADTGPSLLFNVIVALLAPMFLWSTGGDVALARRAAIETLDAYGITGRRSLIAAAKVIAFELAALSSLSQSMSDDISVSMALRLRGNANSMDRAAERNRQSLDQDCRVAEAADLPSEAALEQAVADAQRMVQEANGRIKARQQQAQPQPAGQQPAAPAPRAPMSEQARRTAWAGAMADVAGEMIADMGKLSPKERALEMMRVEALNETVTALMSGEPLPSFPPGR
jgi:hypothetical protein